MSGPEDLGDALSSSDHDASKVSTVLAAGNIGYSAIATGGNATATLKITVPDGPKLRSLPIHYRLRSLPDPYSPLGGDLDVVRAALLETLHSTLGVVSENRGLLGMGGIGKTVLAVALTLDPAIRRAFPAGVVWLSFGREADIRGRQDELILALTGTPSTADSVDEAHGLIDLLAQQLPERLLVVLDDVWEGPQIHAAFRDLPANLQLLVTTRHREVLERFSAVEHQIGLLDPNAAVDFLALSAGVSRTDLPSASGEVLRRCGGLRLALSAVGALIRGGHYDWSDVRQALVDTRLEEFPVPWRLDLADLASVLKVSLDALGADARACLNDFAIFQEDVQVPRAALLTLWSAEGGNTRRAKRLIGELIDRSILSGDVDQGYLVHDLYRDFLADLLGDPQAQHRSLVVRYQRAAPDGWASGPDDGYFFQTLPWHMVRAGMPLDLIYNALWLAAKFKATDVGRLIADCRLKADDYQAERLGGALGLAADSIRERPADLFAQLCGRLTPSDGDDIAKLLAQARIHLPFDQMIPIADGFLGKPGRLRRILRGHQGFVNTIAVTQDGARAISGAQDRTLILWDLDTGSNLQTFVGHTGGVNAVCLFEARNAMISGDDQGAVLFWSLSQDKPVESFNAGNGSVDIIVALSDGWRAVSAGSGEGLMIWDTLARICLGRVPGSKGRILTLAALSDGRVVSGDEAGRVVIWDISARTAPKVLVGTGEPVRVLLNLPNDRIMGIYATGRVDIWSETGELTHGFGPVSLGHHSSAAVSALGLGASGLRDGRIDLWGLFDGEHSGCVRGHSDQVSVLATVPGRPWLLSGSLDETLCVWDLSAPPDLDHNRASEILSLAFTPRGIFFVAGLQSGSVELRASGNWEQAGLPVAMHTHGVQALEFLPGGWRVVSTGDGGTVKVANLMGDEAKTFSLRDEHPKRYAHSISRILALNGHQVVLLGGHGGLEILDLDTKLIAATPPAHGSGIASGVILPDGRIATGGHDGDICLWNIKSGEIVTRLTGDGSPVTGILPHKGGHELLSITGAGQIFVWDLSRDIPISIQRGAEFARDVHRDFQLSHGLLQACALGDEGLVALCCGDKAVRIWDLERATMVKRFTDDHLAAACAFEPNQRKLVVANQHGRVLVFDI